MIARIDKEREILYRLVSQWGFLDERTIRQSKKVDRLITSFMLVAYPRKNGK